jgi:hypothetical protein
MGRKKIKIQPIKDDRNKQVRKSWFGMLAKQVHDRVCLTGVVVGDIFEAQVWTDEEGI